MKKGMPFYIVVAVALLIYGLINFWTGLRCWQLLGRFIPFLDVRLYWFVFWFVAVSFLAGRLGGRFLPDRLGDRLIVLGSYWFAVLFYLVLALFLVEMVVLGGRIAGLMPGGLGGNPGVSLGLGLVVFLAVGGLVGYGWGNARRPRVVHYNVTIPKQGGRLDSLRAAVVSDLHLGHIVHNGRLFRLVDMIEELQPDLVLFPGDIIDENPGPFVKQDMIASFRRLNPRFGMYAVPGNHEYIGGEWETIFEHLKEAGITVLRDDYVKVGDSFTLVGRDELARGYFSGERRKELDEVMKGADRSLPVIMLDHQPVDLEEAMRQGVDLMLSGHTHRGQMFPNNFITGKIYDVDWGYLRRESLQVIVSCGFGTWGPPVRVGSRPEIVDIEISFVQD
ncbi:MAG: metallophosphoesterase [Bacillota bacterium]